MQLHDFFVLRTPLLPIQAFEHFVNGDTDRIRELLKNDSILEALYLASNSLFSATKTWLQSPLETPIPKKLEVSLTKFITRMSSRPTPFGTLAGVSLGEVVDLAETVLTIGPEETYRKVARIDSEALSMVCDLASSDGPHADTKLEANSSWWVSPLGIHYVVTSVAEDKKSRNHHLALTDTTQEILEVLSSLGSDVWLYRDIVKHCVDSFNVPYNDAECFIHQLTKDQLLLPAASPVVSGSTSLDGIIAALTNTSRIEVPGLVEIRDAIEKINNKPLGSVPREAARVQAQYPSIKSLQTANWIQVDLAKPVSVLTLSCDHVHKLIETAETISTFYPVFDRLADFKSLFIERYGPSRWIPLAEALDVNLGIGFPLRHPSVPVNDATLLRGVTSCISKRLLNWELDRSDIQAMSESEAPRLPNAFCLVASIGRDPSSSLIFHGAIGPSGARWCARFSHVLPGLEDKLNSHVRAEEAHNPEIVFAEIVHLPARSFGVADERRLGNICARPRLRDHEIVYLGRGSAPASHQFHVRDLDVTVCENRVFVCCRRTGKQIEPRLSNAHNFRSSDLDVYRFLGELQNQDAHEFTGWQWGSVSEQLPFTPRVVLDGIVVCRAGWHWTLHQLRNEAHFTRLIADSQQQYMMPNVVQIKAGDNELLIDLQSKRCLAVLEDEIRRCIQAGQSLRLVEMLPSIDTLAVATGQTRFASEIVVPVLRPKSSIPRLPQFRPPAAKIKRRHNPGDEWLYLKLYGGPSVLKVVLPSVKHIVDRIRSADLIDNWFFVRYADPDPHIRVRAKVRSSGALYTVIRLVNESFAQMLTNGFLKLQVDTYEREIERYGGDRLMLLAETLFTHDSDCAAALWHLFKGDIAESIALDCGVRMTMELSCLLGPPVNMQLLMEQAHAGLLREHYNGNEKGFRQTQSTAFRGSRTRLEQFVRGEFIHGQEVDAAIVARRERLSEALNASGYRFNPWEDSSFISSVIHMSLNRILPHPIRLSELKTYDFALRLLRNPHFANAATNGL